MSSQTSGSLQIHNSLESRSNEMSSIRLQQKSQAAPGHLAVNANLLQSNSSLYTPNSTPFKSWKAEGDGDGMSDLAGHGTAPEHQSPTTSQSGFTSGTGAGMSTAYIPTTSAHGGSEERSPTGPSGGDHAESDDVKDVKNKLNEEKGDTAPAWSELKTKAGKERKRLPLACIACRRKKIRCSGEKPACQHCLRSRIPCVYKVAMRKAAPRTDYMAMLDKRLKRMEERIIKIVPKEEYEATALVPRAIVKPAPPGTAPIRSLSGKKRGADEAFRPEVDAWAKSISTSRLDTKTKPNFLMLQEAEEGRLLSEGAEALPPKDIQDHLAEVFFNNVCGQTYHLLHKPSFMRKLRAGSVPPVLILAVCAISARFSTHPKLNKEPAFLRGEEWASEARDIVLRRYDSPSITILTCLIILGLHEFGTCQGGRSWAFGGQAIRMAYALQLHQDLDHDPFSRTGKAELSFTDREIRRRTMWACFLMDRFNSSGTGRPTFIREETIKIQLPIKESYFEMDIQGPTEDLRGNVPHPVPEGEGQLSNARENMGVAAYTVRAIALWGRVINYLNLGGNELDSHPMWHPESTYAEIKILTETFADSLPPSLHYNEENLRIHDTLGLDGQYLFLHISIQQNILFMNRFAVPNQSGATPPKDVPKEFLTAAGSKAFEAANRISELLQDSESHFVTAPFTGYCAFLSSTVHVFGYFSKNASMEATSKKNLAINVKYLTKMKKYWGMFHWMSENLKEQYRVCADAAQQGSSTGPLQKSSKIFQYGDWFDRYPHGVSQSDFEDPAANSLQEKGGDAVLEQKSDYHTVEEFFSTLTGATPQGRHGSKVKKHKTKKIAPVPQPTIETVEAEMRFDMPMEAPNGSQLPSGYGEMGSTVSSGLFDAQMAYFDPGLALPAHHQPGLVPHFDRQLVFGAYAGMDPASMGTQPHLMDGGGWEAAMGGSGMGGFMPEPSSAWFMPFNIDPPEIGVEMEAFGPMDGTGPYGDPAPVDEEGHLMDRGSGA